MEILKNGNKTFKLKTQWYELSSAEFVECISLYKLLSKGDIDLLDFRLQLLKVLTNYKRPNKWILFLRWITRTQLDAENIDSNLFLLSNLLTFPVRPVYDTEALEILSPAVRKELETKFPFEIDNPDYEAEIKMIQESLNVKFELNYTFTRNLTPFLRIDNTTFNGPVFNVDNDGVLHTDLCVDEFSDAEAFLQIWYATQKDEHLNAFVAMLYRLDRSTYSTAYNQFNAQKIAAVSLNEKQSIVHVFEYFKKYFLNHAMYGMLFSSDGNSVGKFSTGWEEVVQSLANDGQGSQKEIGRWEITSFFNAQFNRLKSQVQSLRQSDWDDGKISRELNIDLEKIEKL